MTRAELPAGDRWLVVPLLFDRGRIVTYEGAEQYQW